MLEGGSDACSEATASAASPAQPSPAYTVRPTGSASQHCQQDLATETRIGGCLKVGQADRGSDTSKHTRLERAGPAPGRGQP